MSSMGGVARDFRVGIACIPSEPGASLRDHRDHFRAPVGDRGAQLIGFECLARAGAARLKPGGHRLLQIAEARREEIELR